MPKLTILMSVFNGSEYVAESISSVLQNYNEGYEFIIVNDGSTDNTSNILSKFQSKIKNLHIINKKNTGLAHSLNVGIRASKGDYLARIDADDICYPERFSKQIKFLDENPEISLVGSNATLIDSSSRIIEKLTLGKLYHKECVTRLEELDKFFPHSSWMMRRECHEILHGYDEFYKKAQDYDFLYRLVEKKFIHCMPEYLVGIRKDNSSMTFSNDCLQYKYVLNAYIRHALRRGYIKQNLIENEKENIQEIIEKWFEKENIRNKVLANQHLMLAKYMIKTRSFFQLIRHIKLAFQEYPSLLFNFKEVKNIRRNPGTLVKKLLHVYQQ